ncbi:hypothetical protein JZ751_005116 [Albula glossodonta]|uniref:Uncharacterized protein n=1 Tax=Albula glossodonta TaxID=121402 RepID=A0A8T2PDG8_9TELE|nr:hypothetical protein JZ751_005116 [Albula glossodonta]
MRKGGLIRLIQVASAAGTSTEQNTNGGRAEQTPAQYHSWRPQRHHLNSMLKKLLQVFLCLAKSGQQGQVVRGVALIGQAVGCPYVPLIHECQSGQELQSLFRSLTVFWGIQHQVSRESSYRFPADLAFLTCLSQCVGVLVTWLCHVSLGSRVEDVIHSEGGFRVAGGDLWLPALLQSMGVG